MDCKRTRDSEAAADTSGEPPEVWGECCRVDDLHSAAVADKEVAKEHAQWWDPRLKARWNAADASPPGVVAEGISAWEAGQRSKTSGQELTAEDERAHRA